ncbi:MAG: LysR family transcriptional regulator [Porticoccaceae bacterium]|nr:LysR family transcriptional regulator [Porticoccaceae bacterium]
MKITLDIDLLRTLVAFADTGSFKGAAALVFRTQPAVSMQMKRLENLIGQSLFVKKGRELTFSEQGLRLAVQARKILALHDEVAAEWAAEDSGETISFGLPEDYAPQILPHLLATFAEKYPKTSLEVITDTSPILEKKLHDGTLDLAVLATVSAGTNDIILGREPIEWVTSKGHATHKKQPLPLALFADSSPIYQATVQSLGLLSAPSDKALQFNIMLTSKSPTVLTSAALAGYAVTTLARSIVPDTLRILTEDDGFPCLGFVDLIMRGTADSQSIATSQLTEEILAIFREGFAVNNKP